MLLDLGLPDMDGIEVTRRLREWSEAPFIVLSARGEEADKVAALDAGADDYLTKPFAVGELLARIRVALRHRERLRGGEEPASVSVGPIRVDLAARRVWTGAQEVHLTPTEYRLLTTLVRHRGRLVTQRQLLKEVWGLAAVNQAHYLRVYMAQLRRKLEPDPARKRRERERLMVVYRDTLDRSQTAAYDQAAKTILCDCGCHPQSVFDCACARAAEMPDEVRAVVEQEKTGEEVIAAYVARYGEKIRIAPTSHGFNLLAWAGPGVGILTAALVVALLLRRWKAKASLERTAALPATALAESDPYAVRLERELRDLDR